MEKERKETQKELSEKNEDSVFVTYILIAILVALIAGLGGYYVAIHLIAKQYDVERYTGQNQEEIEQVISALTRAVEACAGDEKAANDAGCKELNNPSSLAAVADAFVNNRGSRLSLSLIHI